jgi:hypothetical protein
MAKDVVGIALLLRPAGGTTSARYNSRGFGGKASILGHQFRSNCRPGCGCELVWRQHGAGWNVQREGIENGKACAAERTRKGKRVTHPANFAKRSDAELMQ